MTGLTPQQRGGQTRRERTRKQVGDALEALLEDRHYDDIRAAEIIELADVGTATFYQVIGNKSVAMGTLVLRRLGSELLALDTAEALSRPQESLRFLTRLLGRFGFECPRHARGYCRAYDTDLAHLPADVTTHHPAGELKRIVLRLLSAAARSNLCPTYLATDEVAALAVAQALSAGNTMPTENWRQRISDLNRLLHLHVEDD